MHTVVLEALFVHDQVTATEHVASPVPSAVGLLVLVAATILVVTAVQRTMQRAFALAAEAARVAAAGLGTMLLLAALVLVVALVFVQG